MGHPYIPVSNTVKLEMIFTLGGQRVENVVHFLHLTGNPSPTNMNDLASAMEGWWNTNLAPEMSNALSLALIRVTNLTTQSSPVIEHTGSLPSPGLQTGAPNPNNCALVTKLVTPARGRSYRGRVYNMGWPSVNNATPTTAPGPAGTYNDAWSLLVTTPITNWSLVVVSYMADKAWRTSGVITTVTTCVTNPEIDSQRRRLAGRGQ